MIMNCFFHFLTSAQARFSWLLLISVVGMSTNSVADTQHDYEAAKTYLLQPSDSASYAHTVSLVDQVLPPVAQESLTKTRDIASHPDTLAPLAAQQLHGESTSIGNTLHNTAVTASQQLIEPPAVQAAFATEVQANASGMLDGTSSDCHQQHITRTTLEEKICQTASSFDQVCDRHLVLTHQQHLTSTVSEMSVSSHLQLRGAHAALAMPVPAGVITRIQLHLSNAHNPWLCFRSYTLFVNGVAAASYHGRCGRHLGELWFSTTQPVAIPFSHGSVELTLSDGGLSGVSAGSVSYQAQESVPIKTWQSTCEAIPANCRVTEDHCLEANTAHHIDGMSLSAACWHRRVHYHCEATHSNSCSLLPQQGCTLTRTQCLHRVLGACVNTVQTWACPHREVMSHRLPCGESIYCLDGKCDIAPNEKNHTFDEAATRLSAVSFMGEDVRSQALTPEKAAQPVRVFTGVAVHCRDVMLGSMNCCADHGWAKGVVMRCNDEEQRLGRARETGGLAVFVGRYCSHHTLGVCVEHKEGFCLFPSRIAADVQQSGRLMQLHRSFGLGELPDCSGLSLAEFQQLNFTQIDFSNAIAAVRERVSIPDPARTTATLQEHVMQQATATSTATTVESITLSTGRVGAD